MNADPCLSCPLPDCDEADKRCALKQANNAYSRLRKCGRVDEITPELRDGYNAWFTAWRLERDARRSEERASK